MSTRSQIAIWNGNNTFTSIYCHIGDPAHVWPRLTEGYPTTGKVLQLMALGGLCQVGRHIGEKHDYNDYALADKNDWCKAFGRDRDQPHDAETELPDWNAWVQHCQDYDAEYAYLYDNGQWLCYEVSATGLTQIPNVTLYLSNEQAKAAPVYKEPLTAPLYLSDEYRALQVELAELCAELPAIREAVRKAQVAVNRSRSHTEKGKAARTARITAELAEGHNDTRRSRLKNQIDLSLVRHLRAEAIDEINRDGLAWEEFKLAHPIKHPYWYTDYAPEVDAERERHQQVLAAWKERAAASCPKDFSEEMRESVYGRIGTYVGNHRLHTRLDTEKMQTYEALLAEAIIKEVDYRAFCRERDRVEALEAIERYKELQPLIKFPISPKYGWHGNAFEPTDAWVSDGFVAFLRPEKPSKTIEKLLPHTNLRGSARYQKWEDGFLAIARAAEKLPVTLLGWRKGKIDNYGSSSLYDVVYFDTPNGIRGMKAHIYAILAAAHCFDEVALLLTTLSDNREVETFAFYVQGELVGLSTPLTYIETLTKPRGDNDNA